MLTIRGCRGTPMTSPIAPVKVLAETALALREHREHGSAESRMDSRSGSGARRTTKGIGGRGSGSEGLNALAKDRPGQSLDVDPVGCGDLFRGW